MVASDPNSSSATLQSVESGSDLEFGRRLKLIRELFGYSQRELAKRAGITNSSISMVEQGLVSPSLHSLSLILGALPLSFADFFYWDPALTYVPNSSPSPDRLAALALLEGEVSPFAVASTQGIEIVVVSGKVSCQINTLQVPLITGERVRVPPRAIYRVCNLFQGPSSVAIRL